MKLIHKQKKTVIKINKIKTNKINLNQKIQKKIQIMIKMLKKFKNISHSIISKEEKLKRIKIAKAMEV
jgi:hypothetical protein